MTRKMLLAVLALVLSIATLEAQRKRGYFVGTITDTMCGADHKMMGNTPPTECTKACVKSGSKYALAEGKNVYELSDQKTPEKFAGQKVKVTGTLNAKTKTIEVKKIEAAR
ncbi:MAG: DUF5818 domain-containing protein [Gammaproteobacteria bacterium]